MNKINLVTKPKNELNEIFQSKNLQFSFVNDKYEQLTTSFKCRDFLGDFLWSKVNKSPVSIFGLEYDFSKNPYDEEVFRLSLEFPDNETKEIFLKNLNFLHEKEKKAEVSEFCLLETQDPLTLIIEANPIWQSTIWKTSLYSFYLKIMCYPSLKQLQSPEDSYFDLLTEEKENILLSKVKTTEYFNSSSLLFNHNHRGFLSILKVNQYNKEREETKPLFEDFNFIFGTSV